MQPYPLPLGAVRYKIFNDTVPVDGTFEADAEQGLGGFVGHITDVIGEVSTDFFGNRLCTNYEHRDHLPRPTRTTPEPATRRWPATRGRTSTRTRRCVFDADGAPIIDTNDPGGTCYSDRNGDIVMPNLGPDRYTASVMPPAGQQWYQTNTLEGNHDWDMWIAEGDTGYDNELTVGGREGPARPAGVRALGLQPNANGTRDRSEDDRRDHRVRDRRRGRPPHRHPRRWHAPTRPPSPRPVRPSS